MNSYSQQLIYTAILIVIVIVVILLTKKAIRRFGLIRSIEVNRRKVIYYLSYLIIYLVSASILAIIWGVDFKQIAFAFSSILAVLGVGFFAQWSIPVSYTHLTLPTKRIV